MLIMAQGMDNYILAKERLAQKRNPNDVTFIYHHPSDSPKAVVKVFPLKKHSLSVKK